MTDYQQLDQQAKQIIQQNDRGTYTIPTAGLYPYQWNWDSALTAFGIAQYDLKRAWQEFETLFSGQWENGMVPHILFHQQDDGYFPGPDVWDTKQKLASSGITQPPIAATFIRKLYEKDQAFGTEYVKKLFPKICRWHEWFMAHRLEKYGIAVTHPWESGRDNAVEWDQPLTRVDISQVGTYQRRDTSHVDADMRPTKLDYDRYLSLVYFGRDNQWDESVIRAQGAFRVCDPTMSFTLIRANKDLTWLAEQIGEKTERLQQITDELSDAASGLWQEDLKSYTARDAKDGAFANAISNASFLNWFAGIDNPVALESLQKIMAETPYAVPSHPASAETYDANRYWRGPIWVIMNTMIAMGLAEQGHADLAETIRQKSEDLIIKGGFAEYFNPENGAPAGGGNFSWTAACWLGWVSPTARQEG